MFCIDLMPFCYDLMRIQPEKRWKRVRLRVLYYVILCVKQVFRFPRRDGLLTKLSILLRLITLLVFGSLEIVINLKASTMGFSPILSL